MDRKKLVLLLGALIIAIGTAFAARSMFAGAAAPEAEAGPAQPQGPKVLVANRGLPVGTIITADAIGYQQWPQELVQDAYFIDGESDVEKLLGTVVRHPITAGEPVTQGSLVAPGDRGFLAAALGPGMRAVTIPVSAKTGVAGFIFPGDRVDLIMTQTVKSQGDGEGSLQAAETILKNLRVLATDNRTTQETNDGKSVVKKARTVTLEVTPRISEKIAVAQTIGNLTLSLRSIADNQSELEAAIASGDIKIPDDATPEEEEKLLREAMARPIDTGTTYVTGGDVSRFQRSSLPRKPAEQIRDIADAFVGAAAAQMAGAPEYQNSGPARPAVPAGPQVTVTRGKSTEQVVVGKTGAIVSGQVENIENAKNTVPAAGAALIR